MMKNSYIVLLLLIIALFASTWFTSCTKDATKAPTPDTMVTEKPPVIVPTVDSLRLGLIAWYMFNNNNSADSSGNGYHGTAFNTTSVSDRNGKANGAFYFDGATSYIQVKDNVPLRLSNTSFTINTWVRINGYNASFGSIILSKRGTGSNTGWNYGIHGYSSGVPTPVGLTTFQVSSGIDPFAAGVKVLNIDTWYMLTTEYNVQKQQLVFYVNGVLDNVVNYIPSPTLYETSDVFIGRDNPLNGTGYFFMGALDDTRIYGRLLSPNLIQKLLVYPN